MVEFGSGNIYISKPDGETALLGKINNVEIEPASTIEDDPVYIPYFKEHETTIEGSCKFYKNTLMYLAGVAQLAIDICPNRKVAHLANHAKKRRARKKNLNRAIYILEAEG